MNSPLTPAGKPRLTVRELVILGLLGGLMMAGQVAMASLPNIEPVTLFVIAITLVFGWKALYSIYLFVLLEGLIFGFGLWFINYLYIWSVLFLAVMLLRNNRSYLVWAVVAAAFGLFFGALCAIPYFVMGGPAMALSYWISGIPYDLLHCAGNAVLVGCLLKPLHALLTRLCKQRGT